MARMDSSKGRPPQLVAGSSSEQLHRLCKHILGPGVPDGLLDYRFRSALKVMSTAPAAAAVDDVKMDEFVIAEQIKKYLVSVCRKYQSNFRKDPNSCIMLNKVAFLFAVHMYYNYYNVKIVHPAPAPRFTPFWLS